MTNEQFDNILRSMEMAFLAVLKGGVELARTPEGFRRCIEGYEYLATKAEERGMDDLVVKARRRIDLFRTAKAFADIAMELAEAEFASAAGSK